MKGSTGIEFDGSQTCQSMESFYAFWTGIDRIDAEAERFGIQPRHPRELWKVRYLVMCQQNDLDEFRRDGETIFRNPIILE